MSVLPETEIKGDSDTSFRGIVYDSRAVRPGDVFVALKGSQQNGHNFIPEAVQRGAVAVVLENACTLNGPVMVKVPSTRRALALLASEFYRAPAKRLNIIGITGTNGKTTISRLVKNVLEIAGYHVGLIGTIEYWIGEERITAELTTPESLDLHRMFRKMIDKGVEVTRVTGEPVHIDAQGLSDAAQVRRAHRRHSQVVDCPRVRSQVHRARAKRYRHHCPCVTFVCLRPEARQCEGDDAKTDRHGREHDR